MSDSKPEFELLDLERDIMEYASNAHGPHIPAFIELTQAIAARFGVLISDKVAVQMVPIAGAVSAATLNYLFMKHYQDVATGHFVVQYRMVRLSARNSTREFLESQRNRFEEDLADAETRLNAFLADMAASVTPW